MAKPQLRVLQLAAYGSNIGDNANISGIRNELAKSLVDYTLVFDDWDIVDFSWSLDDFDEHTLNNINGYDLFIIGGGGFLELIPGTHTWTGTRINIPKDIFEKITVPTVFYAIGIDTVRADLDGRPIDTEIKKFSRFVEFVSGIDHFLLSTRHDGSLQVVERLLGKEYANAFDLVPDGGFFSTFRKFYHPELNPEKINIAINFGGDLIDARFSSDYPSDPVPNNPLKLKRPADYEVYTASSHMGYCKFLTSFANVIRQLSFDRQDIQWILVPHIYRDLEVSYHLLNEAGFPYCRREMFVAPYIQGFNAKDYIVDLYQQCSLSIGMRFHANVCPIGLGTPSIGLGTFPMIKSLYQSLNVSEQFIQAEAGDQFEQSLYCLIKASINDQDKIRAKYHRMKDQLNAMNSAFHAKIASVLRV